MVVLLSRVAAFSLVMACIAEKYQWQIRKETPKFKLTCI